MRRILAAGLLLSLGCASAPSADRDGFVPLFNGKDLSGWMQVNCAPETFRAEDGMIITTGKPTGVLRSVRMYENYIVEFDWMHLKERGNSGFFVHSGAMPSKGVPFTKGHEIQVLDGDSQDGSWTGHGDVFSIHGATFEPDRPHPKGWMRCLPSEKRANPAGQWNHYRVVVNDGTIKLAVNGKDVSGGTKCKPRKGYICLESEGSECHFKNLKIKELPSTNPPADEVAAADQGFKSLYSGLDLRGWVIEVGGEEHWKPKDWVLDFDGKGGAKIATEGRYANFVLIFDWRWNDKNTLGAPAICIRGTKTFPLTPAEKSREWIRSEVRVQGKRVMVLRDSRTEIDDRSEGLPERGPFCIASGGPVQIANLFIKELD
ncbi:MAG TPA: family 16 glycoside hydrolase [Planctomycetota bacterium]|nr:family 16 glycoside hydrolase [Planctomycetota bacterium]